VERKTLKSIQVVQIKLFWVENTHLPGKRGRGGGKGRTNMFDCSFTKEKGNMQKKKGQRPSQGRDHAAGSGRTGKGNNIKGGKPGFLRR